MAVDEGAAGSTQSIQLRLPVERRFVATARALTSSVGAQSDLTVDDIEDLQMAVDEACSLLILQALPETGMDFAFQVSQGSVDVFITVTSVPQAKVDRATLAWVVLAALVTGLEVVATGDRLGLRFGKRRQDVHR